MTAVVVFTGDRQFSWLSWLKCGFRHCFVLQRLETGWVLIDPLCGRLSIQYLADLPLAKILHHYSAAGAIPVPIFKQSNPHKQRRGSFLTLLQPMTCVAIVKTVLGLRAPFIWTPWQLFERLLTDHANRTAKLDDPHSMDTKVR